MTTRFGNAYIALLKWLPGESYTGSDWHRSNPFATRRLAEDYAEAMTEGGRMELHEIERVSAHPERIIR